MGTPAVTRRAPGGGGRCRAGPGHGASTATPGDLGCTCRRSQEDPMDDRQDAPQQDGGRPASTPSPGPAGPEGRSSETTVLGRIDLVDYEGYGGLSPA